MKPYENTVKEIWNWGGHSTRDIPSSGHLRFASQEYNTPVRR